MAQSRDIGNIGQTRYKTKTNKKTHNTTQRTNKMSNTDQTRKPGVESGACEW